MVGTLSRPICRIAPVVKPPATFEMPPLAQALHLAVSHPYIYRRMTTPGMAVPMNSILKRGNFLSAGILRELALQIGVKPLTILLSLQTLL